MPYEKVSSLKFLTPLFLCSFDWTNFIGNKRDFPIDLYLY